MSATAASLTVIIHSRPFWSATASLEVSVRGERTTATPARLTDVVLDFSITGDDIDRVHAERAIDLAVNKYCSVKDSLDPAIPVRWTLTLNGVGG